jgi:hypothetical protein
VTKRGFCDSLICKARQNDVKGLYISRDYKKNKEKNMDKKLIIEIGWNDFFLIDESVPIDSIMKLTKLQKESHNGKDYYSEDLDYKLQIFYVDASRIRPLTETEKEENEIKSLNASLKWQKEKNKEKDEEIKKLKCQILMVKEEN